MLPDKSTQQEWFKEYIEPHERILRGWLVADYGGEHDVEDVIQETYTKILETYKKRPILSPKAYLFSSARHIIISRFRKEKPHKKVYLEDIEAMGILNDDSIVSHQIMRSEELELLKDAIRALPQRCRQIITLRKIHGLSQKEVASKLGITVNTVETQTAIAMRKLSAFFERYHGN